MKRKFSFINVRGIITLVVILAVVDVAVAFGMAPFLTRFSQDQFNRFSSTKLVVGSVRFHPMLLSFGISDVEAFNPKTSTRIFKAEHAACRLSLVSLSRKRIGFSSITLDRVELEAVKDSSGKYNFEVDQPQGGKWDAFKGMVTRDNLDLYGKLYDKLKMLTRMNSQMKRNASSEPAMEELPRGRVIHFDPEREPVVEIDHLELKNGTFVLSERGAQVPPFRQVYLLVKNFRLYRSNEVSFTKLEARGKFEAEKKGSFDLNVNQKKEIATIAAEVQNLDLRAFAPIYEKSAPVGFERGFLTLDSQSKIEGEALVSNTHLKLKDYFMTSKKSFGFFGGVSGPIVEALNRRKELDLKFKISGTPDKPSFSGLNEAVMDLVKEDLGQAVSSGSLADKIKSFF
jgi:hypothetical protein